MQGLFVGYLVTILFHNLILKQNLKSFASKQKFGYSFKPNGEKKIMTKSKTFNKYYWHLLFTQYCINIQKFEDNLRKIMTKSNTFNK